MAYMDFHLLVGQWNFKLGEVVSRGHQELVQKLKEEFVSSDDVA